MLSEDAVPDPQGIHDYGAAVWWTAMLMTTLGPTSWPVTVGGRVLCFFLGLYAFTIFGYVAANKIWLDVLALMMEGNLYAIP